MEIRKGIHTDKENIIDFIDYVFSKAHRPHDFTTLLPKLYGDCVDSTSFHYLVEEENKIRAVVCSYPITVHLGEEELTGAAIGSVSVHPRDKGKGYMKALMNRAIEDMKESGFTFSVLSGQRQRYGYFGYHLAGIILSFQLSRKNIHHSFSSEEENEKAVITKQLLTEDSPYLDSVFNLYKTQPVSCRLREDFLTTTITWNMQAYALCKENHSSETIQTEVIGYMVCFENYISELLLKDWEDFPLFCVNCLKEHDSWKVAAAPWEVEKIRILSQIAESRSINDSGMYQIFDYPKMIRALLRLKSRYRKLECSTLVLDIEREKITVTVTPENIIVEKGGGWPDVVLSSEEAALLLFSSYGESCLPHIYDKLPKGWFPLPLAFQNGDLI